MNGKTVRGSLCVLALGLWVSMVYGGSRTDPCSMNEPCNEPMRVIKIAVLNDVQAPVSAAHIRESLREAFCLLESACIDYAIDKETIWPYTGDVSAWGIDQAFRLEELSPATSHMRMVFTNKKLFVKDVAASQRDKNVRETAEWAALSSPAFGFILIYNADERYQDRDLSGRSALTHVEIHEILHLFGIEHDDHPDSVMYQGIRGSYGNCNQEIIMQIKSHRWKTWFKHYDAAEGTKE